MVAGLILLPVVGFALIVLLVVRFVMMGRRIEDLERRLWRLEHPDNPESAPAETPPTRSAPSARPSIPASSSGAALATNTLPPLPRKPSRSREEWEAFVGGRLLNRIGVFALILGVGFFLKYAFDNNWISEPVRVLIGASAGVVCLWGARRTAARGFAIFAQGLVGGGAAILYLSIYASFNYYSLIPQLPAALLMAVVTGVTLVQAIRYDSLTIGILGWLGGVLTPALLSTGENSEARLFTYLALLAVAILALALREPRWTILMVLSWAGTWVWYWVWHWEFYDASAMTMTLFFVLLFWSLVHAAEVLRDRLDVVFGWERRTLLVANGVMTVMAVLAVVPSSRADADTIIGCVLTGMAIVYALSPVLARREVPSLARVFVSTLAAAAMFFAIGYLAEDFVRVIGWSVLVVACIWSARQWSLDHLVIVAQIALGLTALRLLGTPNAIFAQEIRDHQMIASLRTVAYAALSLGAACSWWLIRERHDLPRTRAMFLVASAVSIVLLATVEVNDALRVWRLDTDGDVTMVRWFVSVMALGVLWSSLGVGSLGLGVRTALRPLVITGIVVLIFGALIGTFRGLSVSTTAFYTPVLNVRVVSLLVIVGLLTLSIWLLNSARGMIDVAAFFVSLFSVGVVMVIFVLLTGETRDLFEQLIAQAHAATFENGVLSDIPNGPSVAVLRDLQQLSLSGIWLLYSAVLMVIGFWRSHRGTRIVAMVLFGLSIAKIFLYDLSFLETLYRIFSFIGLGVILLTVSYGYQRYKDVLMADRPRT